MFIRKVKNRSGSVSIQIISKQDSRYRVAETLGSATDSEEIEKLWLRARIRLKQIEHVNQPALIVDPDEMAIEAFIESLANANIRVIGPELVFGTLFNRIGFNQIPDNLFRHMTVTRLVYPGSKLKTVDYLKRYQGVSVSVDRLYRFLDELGNKYQETAEQIAFNYTRETLKGEISVVFYDLTTLYFEAEDEDDLRKIGFSKDGKFQQPQIMLGLPVGMNGYPIGYDIFTGNTFEGHTLIPVIKKFQQKFNLAKPTVIADSGLLSKNNLKELASEGCCYIIGARIKSESAKIKRQILEFRPADQESREVTKDSRARLIIGYSANRAKRDEQNRRRGLKRLEASLRSGKLTKKHINSRGYNKYLKLKGKVEVEIDYEKFAADGQWDGLKGYVTNSDLPAAAVIQNYTQLWQIEKAFRISKTDLRVRPIFHRLKHRIAAHICIAFVAYTVYKELERRLYQYRAPFSVKRAGELTHNMYSIDYLLPKSLKQKTAVLKMDKDQSLLCELIKKI